MKDPHNYAKVGYSMILVAGSLAAIGLIALFTADDVFTSRQYFKRQHSSF